MANFKRRRPRLKTRAGYGKNTWDRRFGFLSHNAFISWPAWWDRQFNTRPKRARTAYLEKRIMQGDDPDNVAWPISGHKPHRYYW